MACHSRIALRLVSGSRAQEVLSATVRAVELGGAGGLRRPEREARFAPWRRGGSVKLRHRDGAQRDKRRLGDGVDLRAVEGVPEEIVLVALQVHAVGICADV